MRRNTLPNPKRIKSEAWKYFFQAEQAFAFQEYDKALRLYLRAKRKSPRGRAHMVSSYRIGTIYYYREQYKRASGEFSYFLQKFPNSDLSFDVAYNLAASEFQLQNYTKADSILSKFPTSEVSRQGRERAQMVYRLSALIAAAMGNHPKAIVAYAAQIQLPKSESKRQKIHERVDFHLNKIRNRLALETLLAKVSEPITRSKIVERIDRMRLAGQTQQRSTPATPAGPAYSQNMFPTGRSGVSHSRNRIGVALPLSGRWKSYGVRALDAIMLASEIYNEGNDSNLKLFIKDTGSDPLKARNAVDSLVFKNRVLAIIGPTSWKESLAVGRRAEQLGVVNLSLTVKEGVSARGQHLFQNGLTARVQVENLVRYCFEEKNFRRFGILAPNDSFGREMKDRFWDLVDYYGGKIVAYKVYPTKETDFQSHIRELTGLKNLKLRSEEWRALREFVDQQKAEGVRNPKAQLPPVVDFDAIFIPDTPKALGQIAPSLAYFDVIGYPLLGTIEWNTRQLYKRGGRYVEGAIFPGGISLTSRNPRQRKFIQRYRKTFGTNPDLLSAQAFEAMELLSEAISRTSSNNPDDLKYELSRIREYASPLGTVSFDNTRVASRKLPIYTLEYGGRISEN